MEILRSLPQPNSPKFLRENTYAICIFRGMQMYYEIRGTGQRLLIISGTGGDLQRSPTIFDSPLAPQFEILAYDQRSARKLK